MKIVKWFVLAKSLKSKRNEPFHWRDDLSRCSGEYYHHLFNVRNSQTAFKADCFWVASESDDRQSFQQLSLSSRFSLRTAHQSSSLIKQENDSELLVNNSNLVVKTWADNEIGGEFFSGTFCWAVKLKKSTAELLERFAFSTKAVFMEQENCVNSRRIFDDGEKI